MSPVHTYQPDVTCRIWGRQEGASPAIPAANVAQSQTPYLKFMVVQKVLYISENLPQLLLVFQMLDRPDHGYSMPRYI